MALADGSASTDPVHDFAEERASEETTSEPDVQIIEALKSIKDRLFVLKLGESMESLILERNPTRRLELQASSSYHRLLIHRCAAYYKLFPEADPQVKTMIVTTMTTESRIPTRRLADLVPLESSPLPAFKIMRRDERSRSKPSSLGGSVAGEEAELSDSVEPSEAGSSSRGASKSGKKKAMTIAEREAAYNEARSRIFMDFEEKEKEKEKDMSASSSTHSLVSGSAGNGGGSSIGDADDGGSTAPTESEWSGPVARDHSYNVKERDREKERDSRRNSGPGRSLRPSAREYNPNGTNSHNYHPPLFDPSAPRPHPSTLFDPQAGPQPAFYPVYPYPPPPPGYFQQFPGYMPYPPYPFPHPTPSSSSESSASSPAEPYPPPPQHQYPTNAYGWMPPHGQPPGLPPPQPPMQPLQMQTSGPPRNGQMTLPHIPQQQSHHTPSPQSPHPPPSAITHQPNPLNGHPPPPLYPSYSGHPNQPGPFYPPNQPAPQQLPPLHFGQGNSSTHPSVVNSPVNVNGLPPHPNHNNGPHSIDSFNGQPPFHERSQTIGSPDVRGHQPPRGMASSSFSTLPTKRPQHNLRSPWSYPGVGQAVGGMESVVGPRLSGSGRRTSGLSNGPSKPRTEDTSSTASSSAGSSSSNNTFTSTASCTHPLPKRPDWAIGLTPQPTSHHGHSHHPISSQRQQQHGMASPISPMSQRGSPHHQNPPPHHQNHSAPHHQNQSQHTAPSVLQANDFPPLGGPGSVPAERRGPAGAWTNSSNRSVMAPPPPSAAQVLSGGNVGRGRSTNTRLDEHDRAFERPPPKGSVELFNPKASGTVNGRRSGGGSGSISGSGSGSISGSGSSISGNSSVSAAHGAEREKEREKAVASAILVDKMSALQMKEDGVGDAAASASGGEKGTGSRGGPVDPPAAQLEVVVSAGAGGGGAVFSEAGTSND